MEGTALETQQNRGSLARGVLLDTKYGANTSIGQDQKWSTGLSFVCSEKRKRLGEPQTPKEKKGKVTAMKKLVLALALLIAAAAGAGSGRLSAFCCPEDPPPLCPPACANR